MSKMSSLCLDLQEAIASGASFEVIARQFDVPVQWVIDAARMAEDIEDYSDSMLASDISKISGDY